MESNDSSFHTAKGLPYQNLLFLRGEKSELVCFMDEPGAHLFITYITSEPMSAYKCEGVRSSKIFRQTNRLTPIHRAIPYHLLRRESSVGLKIKCVVESTAREKLNFLKTFYACLS